MMQFIYLMIVRLDEHYTAARQLKVARLKQAQENIRLRQLAEDEGELTKHIAILSIAVINISEPACPHCA